jgi:signal transduction histidine kinase
MIVELISPLLTKWTDEFDSALLNNNSLCVGLFSVKKELLFSNKAMSALFKGEPFRSFINPSFDQLLKLDNSNSLIFEGFLTLGDYSSVNTSIWAQIYKKEDEFLIIGGANAAQLLEQNKIMHQLNCEISKLQRQLIKEKHTLESTLNQLSIANVKLTELNTDKDLFMSILAHDLRSPFTGLIGLSGVLAENIRIYDIDKIESLVGHINKSARTTFNLLEDLLTWIKSQTGKLVFKPEKLNISNIYTGVLETISPIAREKNISIKSFIAEDLTVFADLEMLKTILRNLISNAIKFTNNGGEIKILAEKTPLFITVSVADNGIGLKSDQINKLFDISQSNTTVGTAGEKGTGLGLMLCHEFVLRHAGMIWVESEVGRGSTFKFTLPVPND